MPNAYVGEDNYHGSISTPAGDDARSAASVRTPLEQLADRTEALRRRGHVPLSGVWLPLVTGTGFGSASADPTAYFYPLRSGRGGTLDRIGFRVTTSDVSATVRVALYASLPNGRPGARLFRSDPIACTTTGIKEATLDIELEPNTLYWVGFLASTEDPAFATWTGAHPDVLETLAGDFLPCFGLEASGGLVDPAPEVIGPTAATPFVIVVRFAAP
jgi:hypothetical protein